MLDPEEPKATDVDIIQRLILEDFIGAEGLIAYTARYGGRWLIIVDDGTTPILFTDAAGFRQVCYTDRQRVSEVWCASQPGILAEMLNLKVDPEADEFIKFLMPLDSEYWWPGDSTPYKEVRHLIPNHYLDVMTGRPQRYWPHQDLGELPLDRAVEASSRLLKGLLTSAAERFGLALALTAGVDSRTSLAGCKEIKDQLAYFTLRQARVSAHNAVDIAVASALSRTLGLKHEVLDGLGKPDPEFQRMFRHNAVFAHDVWGPDAQAIFEWSHLNHVGISSVASGISKCWYRLPWYMGTRMNGLKLGFLVGMGRHPFAVRAFDRWLAGVGNSYNLHILDLFFWEQREGNWVAMCQSEFDSAWRDIFSPFNCRLLLTCMLSVAEHQRTFPRCELHRRMMAALWPAVLGEPINPDSHLSPLESLRCKAGYHYNLIRYAAKNLLVLRTC